MRVGGFSSYVAFLSIGKGGLKPWALRSYVEGCRLNAVSSPEKKKKGDAVLGQAPLEFCAALTLFL